MILTIFEILMISDPDAPLPRNTCRRRRTAAVAPAVAQTAFAVEQERLHTTKEAVPGADAAAQQCWRG